MSTTIISWAQTSFQADVDVAGQGVAALVPRAWRGSFDYCGAAVVAPGLFTLGAAAGQIVQLVTAHSVAPGNAGVLLSTDLLIPGIGLTLPWLQDHTTRVRPPRPVTRPA